MRYFLIALAAMSLGLGIIGIFVPGLPTTVFVLISAWAAARSSPRFAAWLDAHPRFGPIIRNWRDNGAVSRRAKWSATLVMSLSALILFGTVQRLWIAELATAAVTPRMTGEALPYDTGADPDEGIPCIAAAGCHGRRAGAERAPPLWSD